MKHTFTTLNSFCIIKYLQEHICVILSTVGSLLGYFNSLLNPFFYTFFGTDFTKRWRLHLVLFTKVITLVVANIRIIIIIVKATYIVQNNMFVNNNGMYYIMF